MLRASTRSSSVHPQEVPSDYLLPQRLRLLTLPMDSQMRQIHTPVTARQKDTARRPGSRDDSVSSISKEVLSSGGGEERTEGGGQTSGPSQINI